MKSLTQHTTYYIQYTTNRISRSSCVLRRAFHWFTKTRRRKILSSILAILIVLTTLRFIFIVPKEVGAEWWDDDYSYRQPFSFTHNAVITDDRRITFSLDTAELITAGVMQSDCDDTRFTNINGKELRYELTGTCNNAATTYEVVFPSIINGTNPAYVYYGNPSAISASDSLVSTTITELTPNGGDPSITNRTNEEKGPGPVAYWKFDEGADNTCRDGKSDACDLSSNGNDGAGTNPDWHTEDRCISGKCLSFDNISGEIEVADHDSLDFGTGSFTVQTWVRIANRTQRECFVHKHESTGADGGYGLELTADGDFRFGIDDDSSWGPDREAATTFNDNRHQDSKWHHVVGVKNGTTDVRLYVDGIEVAKETDISGVGSVTNNDSLYIGSNGAGENHLKGFLDETKIYNYARSESQIKADFIKGAGSHGSSASFGLQDYEYLSDSLVGYWKFDETSGGAPDYGGCNYTLVRTNDAAYSGGKFGNGTDLESTSSHYFRYADRAEHSITGDLSIAAWINPESNTVSTLYNIVAKIDGAAESYALVQYGDELRMYIDSTSNYETTDAANLATGTWYHVMGVYDASEQTVKLYVDGKLEASTTTGTIPSSIVDNTDLFHVGAQDHNNTPKNFYDGKIDEVRLYSRAFNRKEVEKLYQWEPGPIAYWNFDDNYGSASTSADMLAYRGSTTDQPEYKRHTANWGSEEKALDTEAAAETYQFVKVVAQPNSNSDQKLLCTKDNATGDDVVCQVWDGSSWGNLYSGPPLNNASSNFGFDMAYSSASESALLCYIDADTNQTIPFCDIWTGDEWIYGYDAPLEDDPTPNNITNLELYTDPHSDYIALMHKDAGDEVAAVIWNGSYWEDPTTLDVESSDSGYARSYSAAWDPDGDLMVVWHDDADQEIEGRQWIRSTGSWNAQLDGIITGLPAPVSDVHLHLAAHPFNGEMIVVSANDDDDVDAAFWNGTSWETQTELKDNLGTDAVGGSDNEVHIAYEQGGKYDPRGGDYDAIVVYGHTNSTLAYRVWDTDDSSWGSETDLPDPTNTTMDYHQLASDPTSDNIMFTILDDSGDVETLEWYGSSWESSWTTHETSSNDTYWNSWFTYDYRPDAATDTSTNESHGRMEISMTEEDWVPGKFGSAIDFDGSNDSITIATASDDDVDFNGDETFSGSAWIHVNTMPTTSNQDAIITKWDETSTLRGYRLVVENDDADSTGNFQVEIYDESADQAITATGANDTVNEDTWYHVSFTFNGGTAGAAGDLTLYTDGVQTDSNSANASFLGLEDIATDFSVGDYDATDVIANDTAFTGVIDDVRIYDYERTQEQVVQDMNAGHPAPGSPIGSSILHLKFDEGYGDIAYDSSPQGNNGDLGGSGEDCSDGGTPCPSWTNSGKIGKALDFDGNNHYIDLGDLSDVDNSNTELTISAWFNLDTLPTSSDTRKSIISKYDINDNQREFLMLVGDYDTSDWDAIHWGVQEAADSYDSTTNVTSNTAISENTWYHVVGVFKGGEYIKLYINGKLDNENANAATDFTDTDEAIYIGMWNDATERPFDGTIDEVKIYNFALTADQVKLLYNQGSAAVWGATSTDSSGNATWSAANEYCPPGQGSTCTAPIGEWKFDENTGHFAYDSSDNNNTGTIANGPMWRPGKHGSALDFDGSDDYVDTGNDTSFDNLHDNAFTASVWIKPDGWGENNSGFVLSTAGGDTGWRMNVHSTQGLSARVDCVTTVANSQSGTDDFSIDSKWHNVAMTYDDAGDRKVYIYIDGKEIEDYDTQPACEGAVESDTSDNFVVGNNEEGSSSWNYDGLIDQVRVYDYVRTPAQIAWDYNQGGPVGWWKFDECQGNIAYDSSGNGNDGTIYPVTLDNTTVGTCNSGTSTEMWNDGTTGKRNASLGFDGDDDYVNAGSDSSIDNIFDGGGTITAWIKPNSFGESSYGRITDKGGDVTDNGAGFFICNDGGTNCINSLSLFFDFDGADAFWWNTPDNTISTGVWQHVALIYNSDSDSNDPTFYIDGIPYTSSESQTSSGTRQSDSANSLYIGNRLNGDRTFDGLIDDVRLYNYELTPQQIRGVISEGAVRFGPLEGSP